MERSLSADAKEKKDSRRVYLTHSVGALFTSDLKVLLHYLRREGIACLSGEEYLAGKEGVLITIDDGHPNDLKIAYPILKEFDAHAVSFLIPLKADLSLRVKDWQAWREVGDRLEVGSHSLTHTKVATAEGDGAPPPEDPNLLRYFGANGADYQPGLAHPEYNTLHHRLETEAERRLRLTAEIVFSKQFIERQIGKPVRLFSFPWGEYDELSISLVQEAGYEAAFAITETLGTNWTISRVHLSPAAEEIRRMPRPG
jgi:peptidoglycan/xylan/chitin deacetylase (PgdA/CDA1 family)